MAGDPGDGELIKCYLQTGSEAAFERLRAKHSGVLHGRFRKRFPAEADDLLQLLWLRVIKGPPNYHDENRFPQYLQRIATNLINDQGRRHTFETLPKNHDVPDNRPTPGERAAVDEEIRRLLRLVPALPCRQRMAFLLMHESEFWEGRQKLEWHDLAMLNGIDASQAWERFERVRNALFSLTHPLDTSHPLDVNCEDALVFLVWTQAQRLSKRQKFTFRYFAGLLNVTENALKLRYKAALNTLAKGLSDQGSVREQKP